MARKGETLDRRAKCHPARAHAALGMCRPCYMAIKNRTTYASAKHAPLVYFVAHETSGLVKIGTTVCLATRLRHMQAGSPVPLSVLFCISGGRTTERALHSRFSAARAHGEWFKLRAIQAELLDLAEESSI